MSSGVIKVIFMYLMNLDASTISGVTGEGKTVSVVGMAVGNGVDGKTEGGDAVDVGFG